MRLGRVLSVRGVRQVGVGRRTSRARSRASGGAGKKVRAVFLVVRFDGFNGRGGSAPRGSRRPQGDQRHLTHLMHGHDGRRDAEHPRDAQRDGVLEHRGRSLRHTPLVKWAHRHVCLFRSSGRETGGGTACRPRFNAVTRDPSCDRPSLAPPRRGGQVATGVCASRVSLCDGLRGNIANGPLFRAAANPESRCADPRA